MSVEGIGRLALRAYPAGVRRDHGEEMIATLLDMRAGSSRGPAREIGSLVLAGLRARAALTAEVSGPRLLADSFAWAATIWCILLPLAVVRFADVHQGFARWPLGLAVVAALALGGRDRLAGLAGIGWTVAYQHHLGGRWIDLRLQIVPLLGFIVMAVAPRATPHRARRVLVLAGALGFASILSWPLAARLFVGASAAGLAIFVADPRLSLACSLVWAGVAGEQIAYGSSAWFAVLAVAPLLTLTAMTRRRALRRGAAL